MRSPLDPAGLVLAVLLWIYMLSLVFPLSRNRHR